MKDKDLEYNDSLINKLVDVGFYCVIIKINFKDLDHIMDLEWTLIICVNSDTMKTSPIGDSLQSNVIVKFT